MLRIAGYFMGFGVPFLALVFGLAKQITIGKGSFLSVNDGVRALCRDVLWWDKIHFADFGMYIARTLNTFLVDFVGIPSTRASEFPLIACGSLFCLIVGAMSGILISSTYSIICKMMLP